MKDKYILDSCIWIETHRNNLKVMTLINPWIEKNEICLVDAIKTEVLRGVRTNKDYERLKLFFNNFPCLSLSWDEVNSLAFECGRRNFFPPLIDIYISQCAILFNKTIVTQDKHFQKIKSIRSFELLFIS